MLAVTNSGKRLSISAVAIEAGVSPALIHNSYPDFAEKIREQMGRAMRMQRDEKATELMTAKAQLTELRAKLRTAQADISKLASLNETLRIEVATLRAVAEGKVVRLTPQ